MKVSELRPLLENFRRELQEHRTLWNNSFGPHGRIMGIVANYKELSEQVDSLLLEQGHLQPYLEHLHSRWALSQAGRVWSILDYAVPLDRDGILKAPSLRGLIEAIQLILGGLVNYPDDYVIRLGALTTIVPEIELADRLCSRLAAVVRPLQHRERSKPDFSICDEYDVQDILRALLRGYFKYTVHENPVPKLAGAKSTRADLTIEELGLIIEVKYVRAPKDQGKIEEQLAQDIVLYSAWEPLKYLFFVIYKSEDLEDRDLLDKFSNPQTINDKSFAVRVINV